MTWATKFGVTLNLDDPVRPGFESTKAASEFRREGQALAQCLDGAIGGALGAGVGNAAMSAAVGGMVDDAMRLMVGTTWRCAIGLWNS
jgi:hypothetical protein